MHGWGVSRSMGPQSAHFSRSRLPLLHSSYSSLVSESSPLPPYAPPLSTPHSRSLPLQILLALFTTLIVLSCLLQFTGFSQGLRHVDELSATTTPMKLMVAAATRTSENAPPDPMDSELFQGILEHLEMDASGEDGSVVFSIAYNSKRVEKGDYVAMDEAAVAPTISVTGSGLFALLLIDIDAPNPQDPSHAPFLHYIVSDLAQNELPQGGNTRQESVAVVPYYPVSPPAGKHRYVAMLFRQPEQKHAPTSDQEVQDKQLSAQRSKFDVAAYAKDHKLVLVETSDFYSQPADKAQ